MARLMRLPEKETPSSQPVAGGQWRSEEHTSELQSLRHLVCRLLLEKKPYSFTRDTAGITNAISMPIMVMTTNSSTSGKAERIRPTRPSFFFNDTATTEIYTLSLHDALPIYAWPISALKPPEVTLNSVSAS